MFKITKIGASSKFYVVSYGYNPFAYILLNMVQKLILKVVNLAKKIGHLFWDVDSTF